MFILRALGGLALTSDRGEIPAPATQRRRLALLAILSAAGAMGVTRERVALLLWPDRSEDSARHALDQLLYTTRRDLGSNAILSAGGTLRLNPDVVASDRGDFEAALADGNVTRAVELYAGPFLDGVHVDGSDEFERWVAEERSTLEQRFVRALDALASLAEARGDYATAIDARRQRLAVDPLSAPATLGLMRTLAASGDRTSAIREATAFTALVSNEIGVPPDPAIVALAEQLRRECARPPATSPSAIAAASPAAGQTAGIVVMGESRAYRSRASQRAVLLRAAAVVVLCALGTFAFVLAAMRSSRSSPVAASPATFSAIAPSESTTAVAVLPFAQSNTTGTVSDGDYFGDGLTDEVIHTLSKVPRLRVVARTSSFALKGSREDAREIGRKLGARALVEGSVRLSAARVRVTVQLVDARTGYEQWSESYERDLSDVFRIQSDIAGAIARQLAPASVSALAASVTPRPRGNAYQLYLRGISALHTGGDMVNAARLLESSLHEDSTFAPTHAALADVYANMADRSAAEPQEAQLLDIAEGHARRSLALDPQLPEASVALGRLLMSKWDWTGADRQFRNAIDANPSFAPAHTRLGILRALQKRFAEAVPEVRRAEELDPLSLGTQSSAAYVLTLARRYSDAEPEARNLIALDSMREDSHFRLASVLLATGRTDEAERELRVAMRVSPNAKLRAMPMLGYTYARGGHVAEALQLRGDIERGMADHSVSPYFAAAYFGAIGDRTRAFRVLDSLAQRRESCLRDVAVDPLMEQLQKDPRFDRVLQTIAAR